MSELGEHQSLISQDKKKRSKINRYSYVITTAVILSVGSLLLTILVYKGKKPPCSEYICSKLIILIPY